MILESYPKGLILLFHSKNKNYLLGKKTTTLVSTNYSLTLVQKR